MSLEAWKLLHATSWTNWCRKFRKVTKKNNSLLSPQLLDAKAARQTWAINFEIAGELMRFFVTAALGSFEAYRYEWTMAVSQQLRKKMYTITKGVIFRHCLKEVDILNIPFSKCWSHEKMIIYIYTVIVLLQIDFTLRQPGSHPTWTIMMSNHVDRLELRFDADGPFSIWDLVPSSFELC